MSMYRGFSTVGRYRKFRLSDFDVAKQDLLNHFSIRRGEKLMHPTFGTIIWNVLFEPLTGEIRQAIIDDVRKIVSYDPRLKVTSVGIDDFQQGIQIAIDLIFVTTNESNTMKIMFDRQSSTLTTA